MSPASAPTPSCNQQADTFSPPIRKQSISAISRRYCLCSALLRKQERGLGRYSRTKETVTGELLGQGHGLGEEVEDVPGRVLLKWQEGREDFQLGLAPGPHPPVAFSSS